MINQKQITAFQKEILDWFIEHKRDLPWRKTRDPYAILISEVMLQQTQVSRVIPKFEAWLKKFPNIQTLARGSIRDVLFSWSGLGYNRRALYLQKLACMVVKNHNGKFSQDEKSLRSLPGIGEYTAKALLCFAFDHEIAVIDTNVKKVIAIRFFKGQVPGKIILQDTAERLLPKGRAYEWNQALMDYASAELKKEKIPIPKQSRFTSSNRFYRGQVVRLLLQNNGQTMQSLFEIIENNGISEETFEHILQGMEKDGLIIRKNKKVSLP